MVEGLSDFEPCQLTVTRDPAYVGSPHSLNYTVHKWNQGCTFIDEYIMKSLDFPLPLGTITLMDGMSETHQDPGEPEFCKDCFNGVDGLLKNEDSRCYND